MQMVEPIPELARIDPGALLSSLSPALRIALAISQKGEEALGSMAGRLQGDPASGVLIMDEIADARRVVAAMAGLLENAELRLLAALSGR